MSVPSITPIAPVRIPSAFDHPDWLWEPKLVGFRAVCIADRDQVRLHSKKGRPFTRFAALSAAMREELNGREVILDGEVVCVDGDGRPQFYSLMFKRARPVFYAFDILWLDGEDLRQLPLRERKRRLRGVVPSDSPCLLMLDGIEHRGSDLFRVVCEQDLEGVVGKRLDAPYAAAKPPTWVKV